MKKHFITTTALAGVFAIGIAGAPFAQGVNPSAPGSAAGGTMAQGGTQGGTAGTQGGTTAPGAGQAGTQRGPTSPDARSGTLGGATTPGGQAGTQGGTTTPGGQTGTQGGQRGTQGDATRPGQGTQGGATQPGGQRGTQGGSLMQDQPILAQATVPGQTGAQPGQMGAQPGMTGAPQAGATGQRDPMRPGGAAPGQQATMNEEQIRGMLSARGYTDISGVERDGDHFKVSEAKRYGRDVEDLRVNARTGQVQDEARLNEDQARNLLEQRGYTEVSDVSRDGDTITAQAKRDDREMRVRIDGNTGAVMPQPASN
ncbi:hypothetical protein [Roseococcus suduntuyensis]|uniref:Peptidase propeptide and YPEB domain-containing protein n=1 Tax=Roseococcus suduntuyensis TaxID=455361 RepID=A0A840AAZ2_9PROT|nr:hypothetical protein [Roseococcus suduntuyensis]MBB3897434.1 hypothetical protein [Roseococcus suduntuyensis]